MILVLCIYDILKKTRKGLKINYQLTRVEAGAPHASDESRKEYQIVNHKDQVAKNVLFKINTTTEKRTLTVKDTIDLTDVPIMNKERNQVDDKA